MSAEEIPAQEIRRNLVRQAGIEIAHNARTGIVAIVAPDPACVILDEIEKEEPSDNPFVRIVLNNGLGFVSKAYQAPPDTRSIYLITPDPERAAALLEGSVPYVRVAVPLDWGTLEQRIARAWEQVEEMRREAQRDEANMGYNSVWETGTQQSPHLDEDREYSSPRRSGHSRYVAARRSANLVGGPQTIQ